jgi:peptide/nickel transport system substrate-binding protein
VLLALALLAAACGGGSDDASETADEADVAVQTDSGDDTEEAMDDDEEAMEDDEPEEDVVEAGTEAEGDVDTEVVEAEEAGKFGGDVVIGIEAEATGLRPWEDACSSPCINMMTSVFDKLVEFRADGTYGPWLAEEFGPNEDFTVWTFKLREGVTFHNGVELTAATIGELWPIWQTGAQTAGPLGSAGVDLENPDSIQVTGDYEFTVTLTRSNSALPATFERPYMLIAEPGAAVDLAEAFSISPVGTGAFMVDKRDLDNETVMVRNPNWWNVDADGNQLPYLDSVTFRPIPDEGTRLDSLLSGTVNAMQTLRQGTIRDTRDSADGLTLYEFQGNNVGGGQFNTAVAPYDDVRVRRGLTQMNNQEAVIGALGGTGISLPGTQWFSPDSPWYSEKAAAAWPSFDFAAGQETLQGYIDDPERSDGLPVGTPISIELSCPPDPTLIAAMQVLEQLWTQSGLVEVNLTNYDQQTHINYALGGPPDWLGEHGAHCWRWSSDNDPSTELNRQLVPYNSEVAVANGLPETLISPTNFFNYFNPEVLGWLNEAIATDNFEERKALYENVMLAFAEDVPVWYSGHTATMIATEDNVVGLNSWELPDGTLGVGHPAAEGRWNQVWIDE